MVLGLASHGRERQRGEDSDERPEQVAGLTAEDLNRIRSVVQTPRFRRTPEMLCPDEPAGQEDDEAQDG